MSYDLLCCGSSLSSYIVAALAAENGQKVLLVDDTDLAWLQSDAYSKYPHESSILGADIACELFQGVESIKTVFDGLLQSKTCEALSYRDEYSDFCLRSKPPFFVGEKSFEDLIFSELIQTSQLKTEKRFEAALRPKQSTGANSTKDAPFLKYVFNSDDVPISEYYKANIGSRSEQICAAMLASIGCVSDRAIGDKQWLRSSFLLFAERHWLNEGYTGLMARLSQKIIENGGEIKSSTFVQSLYLEGKDVRGALLSSFDGVVLAKNIVISTNHKKIYGAIPDEFRDRFVERTLNRVYVDSWWFTNIAIVPKRLVPSAMPKFLVLNDSQDGNLVKVQTVPCGDSDKTAILMSARVPYFPSYFEYDFLKNLSSKLYDELLNLMPFLKSEDVEMNPDPRKDQAEEFTRQYPTSGEGVLPDFFKNYFVQGGKNAQGFWGIDIETDKPNLFFTGRAVYPSLGTYGEILSAFKTASNIINAVKGKF